MPSTKVVGVVAVCALALLLFTAVMSSGSGGSRTVTDESAHENVRMPQIVSLPEDDVDKDFGKKFVDENREQLELWKSGAHASDPLDGAAPMSRADRKKLDPNSKFDKFDEGMLLGAGGDASRQLEGQQVMEMLADLRKTGDALRSTNNIIGSNDNDNDNSIDNNNDNKVAPALVPVVRTPPGANAKPLQEWAEPASATCYVPPGRSSCGPHFIVAGAMKCGTTSMYSYLLNHPQVLPLAPNAKLNGKSILAEKEVRFFNDPTYTQMVNKLGLDDALNQYYNLFREIPPPTSTYFASHENANMITGEASPMYICTRHAATRARGALPYGKVIIMLRNPIDRSYSEFWFRQSLSRSMSTKNAKANPIVLEDVYDEAFLTCALQEIEVAKHCNHEKLISQPTLETVDEFNACWSSQVTLIRDQFKPESDFCIAREGDPLCNNSFRRFCTGNNIKNSLYAHQMVEWVEAFPEAQIMFIKSEDFYADTPKVMKNVERFLGLDMSLDFDWHAVTAKAFNIVNPGTKSAEGRDIVAGEVGLRVGASDHESVSEYPPMSARTRTTLMQFFEPHNRALKRVLGRKSPSW